MHRVTAVHICTCRNDDNGNDNDFLYISFYTNTGDGGVGKSCLMNRFVSNQFDENSFHTIGVEFLNKDIEIDGGYYTLQVIHIQVLLLLINLSNYIVICTQSFLVFLFRRFGTLVRIHLSA